MTPLRPDTVARSLAIGNPADGNEAIAAARESGGAIHVTLEQEIGANMVLLAETAGVFGETAAGVTLGALREAVRARRDRPVRPRRPARHRRRPEDARPGRGHAPADPHRGRRGRCPRATGESLRE